MTCYSIVAFFFNSKTAVLLQTNLQIVTILLIDFFFSWMKPDTNCCSGTTSLRYGYTIRANIDASHLCQHCGMFLWKLSRMFACSFFFFFCLASNVSWSELQIFIMSVLASSVSDDLQANMPLSKCYSCEYYVVIWIAFTRMKIRHLFFFTSCTMTGTLSAVRLLQCHSVFGIHWSDGEVS